MKKRILLVMAAALFSWAGFAQVTPKNLFYKFANGEYRIQGPDDQVYQDGADWIIEFFDERGEGSREVVVEFDPGEVVGIYNKVVIEYEQASGYKVGMWIENDESDVWTNQKVGVVDTYWLLGPSEINGIGIYGTSDWTYPASIRIKKLELVYDPEIPFPDYFTSPINFQNSELKIGHSGIAQGVDSDSPFGLLANDGNWLTVNASDNPSYSVLFAKEGDNVFLDITSSQGCNIPAFLVRLPEGKVFGDVEEISFRYKILDYADYALVTVNTIGENTYGTGIRDLAKCPAVFYSYDHAIKDGLGAWATFTMKTAWFEEGNDSDFENARWSFETDEYVSNLGAIANETVIWLGVGIFGWYGSYSMDDITLTFKEETPCECDVCEPSCECYDPENEICTSVETVKASSFKVFSTPGGLAIKGVESATIYGIDGSVIATAKGQIALPKGVYIVKAGNEVVKAIVK